GSLWRQVCDWLCLRAGRPSRSARRDFLLGLLELSLELLVVGVDLLLERLFGAREHLVELLFHARLADHDQRRLTALQQLPELLRVAARHALAQVSADTADDTAHQGRAEDRRREQDPGDGADRDAAPGPVLRGLLVLVDMDLAILVLGD